MRPFRAAPSIEAPLLGVGAALWLAGEALKPVLVPERCRWCDAPAWDERASKWLRWSHTRPARRLSDALLFGIVPAAAFGGAFALSRRHADSRAARVDALSIGEALVLTADLTLLTKLAVARARPPASASEAPFPDRGNERLSFFSGHTSGTFALAVGAATTASLRGYRGAAALWAVGLPLAALTGYLRIAGGRHYFSDVLVGALVGSAVGALVPWLHARGGAREVP